MKFIKVLMQRQWYETHLENIGNPQGHQFLPGILQSSKADYAYHFDWTLR